MAIEYERIEVDGKIVYKPVPVSPVGFDRQIVDGKVTYSPKSVGLSTNSLEIFQKKLALENLLENSIGLNPKDPTLNLNNALNAPSAIGSTQQKEAALNQVRQQLDKSYGFSPNTASGVSTSGSPPKLNLSNPTSTPATPIPPVTGKPIASTLGKVANGLATVGGAITLSQSVSSLIKEPTVGGGLTTVGALLLLAPNPYAKGAGLGLLALGTIADALNFGKKPTASNAVISKNATTTANSLPLQNLTNGVGYNVVIDGAVTTVDGEILGFINNQVFTSVTAPVGGLAIVATSNSLILIVSDASGSREILISSTGANQRALQNNLSITLQTIAGQPVPPQSPANTPYTPASATIPPSDTPSGGAWDVLDYGEKYKQGTAIADRAVTPNAKTAPSDTVIPNRSQTPLSPTPLPTQPVNPKEKKPDRTGDAKNSPNSTTGASSVTGVPTANAGGSFLEKPSFTARPYVSGVSDPSEAYDPKDVTTGLTRSQMEKAYTDQQKAVQTASQANQQAAIEKDAQGIVRTINNLSTVPRQDLGGLSDRDYQIQAYRNTMAGDLVRVDAFNRALAASQVTTKPESTPIIATPVTPQPVTPTTPTETPNNQTGLVLGSLAGLAATITALKVGSDLLVNNSLSNTPKIEQIAQNTTNANQQSNAATGACTALNSATCTTKLKDSIVDPVIANAGVNQAATDTKLAGLLALLQAVQTGLTTFITSTLGKLDKIKDFLDLNNKIESVKSTIVLALTLHNALMLSQSLGDTLGLILDNVLNVFGNTFRTTEGNQISASEYLGATVKNWIIGVIGVDNYVKLSETLAQANRIYQTGMNILSTVQGAFDAAASAAQASGIKLSLLMNGLRDESVVSPRAYGHQDESPLGNRANLLNRFEQLTTTISDFDSKAQNLVTITSAPIQIKDAVKQSKDDIKAFNDARDASSADNLAAKQAKIDEIKALKPLTEATISKRDDDT